MVSLSSIGAVLISPQNKLLLGRIHAPSCVWLRRRFGESTALKLTFSQLSSLHPFTPLLEHWEASVANSFLSCPLCWLSTQLSWICWVIDHWPLTAFQLPKFRSRHLLSYKLYVLENFFHTHHNGVLKVNGGKHMFSINTFCSFNHNTRINIVFPTLGGVLRSSLPQTHFTVLPILTSTLLSTFPWLCVHS